MQMLFRQQRPNNHPPQPERRRISTRTQGTRSTERSRLRSPPICDCSIRRSATLRPDQSLVTRHVIKLVRPRGCQYTLRRTAAPRGATTTARAAGRTTGRLTTAAPPAATQPARYTPRAQTTALASIVLKAMKPPASNREIVRYFITALLWL